MKPAERISLPTGAEVIFFGFCPDPASGLRAEVEALRAAIVDLKAAAGPLLVSVEEAARRLSISKQTVRRRVVDGSLPSKRVGRRVLVDLSPGLDAKAAGLAARRAMGRR
ncbi:MAG TPA: excisionase family DNA-binding protein [Polyangia bacterium]|jgi:excisionase family DNA binding protein|nr:excisionase family DNA-binding protein [Polyangia bacterium]